MQLNVNRFEYISEDGQCRTSIINNKLYTMTLLNFALLVMICFLLMIELYLMLENLSTI